MTQLHSIPFFCLFYASKPNVLLRNDSTSLDTHSLGGRSRAGSSSLDLLENGETVDDLSEDDVSSVEMGGWVRIANERSEEGRGSGLGGGEREGEREESQLGERDKGRESGWEGWTY